MVYRKQDALKDVPGRVETRDFEGGKGSTRFRDTKRYCNIINHSEGLGLAQVHVSTAMINIPSAMTSSEGCVLQKPS